MTNGRETNVRTVESICTKIHTDDRIVVSLKVKGRRVVHVFGLSSVKVRRSLNPNLKMQGQNILKKSYFGKRMGDAS